MKVFNSIQIVTLFALGPVLIPLLKGANFWGASAALWICGGAWCLLAIWIMAMVYDSLSDSK